MSRSYHRPIRSGWFIYTLHGRSVFKGLSRAVCRQIRLNEQRLLVVMRLDPVSTYDLTYTNLPTHVRPSCVSQVLTVIVQYLEQQQYCLDLRYYGSVSEYSCVVCIIEYGNKYIQTRFGLQGVSAGLS